MKWESAEPLRDIDSSTGPRELRLVEPIFLPERDTAEVLPAEVFLPAEVRPPDDLRSGNHGGYVSLGTFFLG